MRSPILRRRWLVVAVAAGLVAGGGAVFAATHEWSSSAPDRARTPSAGKSYCWGALSGERLDRLLATAPGQRYREVVGRLDYPEVPDERCAIHRVSAGAATAAALPALEFALYGAYQDLQRPEWFGPAAVIAMPLGNDMYGAASDEQAWVALPNCRAETGRFAQLIVREPADASADPVGRRQLLTETLIAVTNEVRRKAGCTGPVLPFPPPLPGPGSRPFDPHSLCGIALPDAVLADHPSWTQQWTGTDPLREDCIVTDSSSPDPMPKLRIEIYRDLMASLEIGERSGVEPAGEPQTVSFSYGNAASYWAVCAARPVTYLVGVKEGENLPSAEQLLTALLLANQERDGCDPRANGAGVP